MICKSMHELQKKGVGLLIGNDSKLTNELKSKLDIYITNDPRMIIALKLCGYEVIESKTLKGIETFA